MKYLLLLLLALPGCSAAMPTPAQQAEVASFGTLLTMCVTDNDTDEAAAACQCGVAQKYQRQVEALCP